MSQEEPPSIIDNVHRKTIRGSVQHAPSGTRPRFTFIESDTPPNTNRRSESDFSFLSFGQQQQNQQEQEFHTRVSTPSLSTSDETFYSANRTPPPLQQHLQQYDHEQELQQQQQQQQQQRTPSIANIQRTIEQEPVDSQYHRHPTLESPFEHHQNSSVDTIRYSLESGYSPLDRLSSSLQNSPLAAPAADYFESRHSNINNNDNHLYSKQHNQSSPPPPPPPLSTRRQQLQSRNMTDPINDASITHKRQFLVSRTDQLMSSQTVIPENESGSDREIVEKPSIPYASDQLAAAPPRKGRHALASSWRKKRLMWLLIILIVIIVIAAVILIPVGVVVIKKNSDKSSDGNHSGNGNSSGNGSGSGSSSPSSSGSAQNIPPSAKGTVLDPSTWLDTLDFNTTYTNATVGGLSVMGLNSSWDDSAQANTNVPALNEPFPYGKLPIRGVNVGGWLVLEPFITPSFFKNSTTDPIVDEWTLITSLVDQEKNNATEDSDDKTVYAQMHMVQAKQVLETHYKTFVTEDTFREIAEAGLDHVRIPYGYWAIKTYDGDMFLPQVSWRYLLRGIEWARKYGLRVNLDLHAVPGSQNGWNHSGRQGWPHWLNQTDPDGMKYGEESLQLHDQISQFFTQPRYKNIITFYGLVNEPKCQTLNATVVTNWTANAYDIVRKNGFDGHVVYGDGFIGAGSWNGKFPNNKYPNMTLDIHQYTIFDQYLIGLSHSAKIGIICNQWTAAMNESGNPTVVGEWSQADNDCCPNLNNVGVGNRWEGTFNQGYGTAPVLTPSCNGGINCTCSVSNEDPNNYPAEYKAYLLQFAELQMDAFESEGGLGSWYWTWYTEDASATQWSYKRGRDAGILPKYAYQRTYKCSSSIPDYVALGLPENY